MRAITLDRPDAPPALSEDLPAPTPTDNEILVRVHASSANPADNSIAGGILAGMGLEHQYPVILGGDYAGVVEQTGAAVSSDKPGDQVFGFVLHANPIVHDGAWAELITVTEELSIAPAARGGRSGDRRCAAAGRHHRRNRHRCAGALRGRRAARGRRRRWRGQPGRPARRAGRRPGDRSGAAGDGPGRTNVMATPSRENLQRVGALLADGSLRIPVQATYPLAQAPEALAALAGEHTQGKLAIQVR